MVEIISKHTGKAVASLSAASVENLVQIQRHTDSHMGSFYFGTVLQDAVYLAFTGQCERFRNRPAKEIRMLWVMYPNLLYLVTAPSSGIRSVAEKREILMVLEAVGLKLSDLGMRYRQGY